MYAYWTLTISGCFELNHHDYIRKLSAVNYFLNISFITPERNRILKNGFQMCTRHITTILASFFPIRKDSQGLRTSGWLKWWLMHLKEEEEEFVMATKRVKSNKSSAALRAVSRINYSILICYHSCQILT